MTVDVTEYADFVNQQRDVMQRMREREARLATAQSECLKSLKGAGYEAFPFGDNRVLVSDPVHRSVPGKVYLEPAGAEPVILALGQVSAFISERS